MRLVDYLALVRDRIGLVIAVVVAVAASAVLLALLQDPAYQASVRLRALPIAPGSAATEFFSNTGEQGNLDTEAELARSEEVAALVVERLDLDVSPGSLIGRIVAVHLGRTSILVIQAEAATPEEAVVLANAFADAYVTVRRADASEALDEAAAVLSSRFLELQRQLDSSQRRLAAAEPGSSEAAQAAAERDTALADMVLVREQQRKLADRSALERGVGEVIQPATSARAVREQSLPRSLVFGVLLGVPLAVAAVLLLDSLSDKVRTEEEAEAATGADVLGTIPFDPRADASHPPLAVDVDPFSVVSEAYRTASLNLANAIRGTAARAILVTSALEGEGKSAVTTNLAVSHAERGEDVLVVEADLRRPRSHVILGAASEPGLAELLEDGITVRAAVQQPRPHLFFTGAGRPIARPDRLLSASDVSARLARVAARARGPLHSGNGHRLLTLLDGPPTLQAAEASALAREADGVILVVRAGVTRRPAAARAAEQIRRADGRILGVVLLGASPQAEVSRRGDAAYRLASGGRAARRRSGRYAGMHTS